MLREEGTERGGCRNRFAHNVNARLTYALKMSPSSLPPRITHHIHDKFTGIYIITPYRSILGPYRMYTIDYATSRIWVMANFGSVDFTMCTPNLDLHVFPFTPHTLLSSRSIANQRVGWLKLSSRESMGSSFAERC
jgi:hypothetical protein